MALALIICNGLAALALCAAIIGGLASAREFLPLEVYTRTHVLLAIFAAFLVLFGHCMTMFYFIGTGIRIKELVAEHAIEEDLVTPTRLFKKRVFPWATMAMLAVMVTFIIGGGVDTGRVPSWLHLLLASSALIIHFAAVQKETQAISANVRLFDHLDTIVTADAEGV